MKHPTLTAQKRDLLKQVDKALETAPSQTDKLREFGRITFVVEGPGTTYTLWCTQEVLTKFRAKVVREFPRSRRKPYKWKYKESQK